MLAMGRALMAGPKLLLLDEPSIGLSPVLVQEIAKIVVEIHERGVPVVLVEQNAELALKIADYAYVMETGRVALEGPGGRTARARTRQARLSWWLMIWLLSDHFWEQWMVRAREQLFATGSRR